MRTTLICVLLVTSTLPAAAGAVYYGRQMEWSSRCPGDWFRARDGKMYWRREQCDERFSGYSSMGIPADGFTNNASRAHARRFRALPDGHIQLY